MRKGMKHPQKKDADLSRAQGVVNTLGDEGVALIEQRPARLLLGIVSALRQTWPGDPLFRQAVFLDQELGRFGAHEGGAPFDEAEQQPMVGTARAGQFGHDFAFVAALRQSVLIETHAFARERQALDLPFDPKPKLIDKLKVAVPDPLPHFANRRALDANFETA